MAVLCTGFDQSSTETQTVTFLKTMSIKVNRVIADQYLEHNETQTDVDLWFFSWRAHQFGSGPSWTIACRHGFLWKTRPLLLPEVRSAWCCLMNSVVRHICMEMNGCACTRPCKHYRAVTVSDCCSQKQHCCSIFRRYFKKCCQLRHCLLCVACIMEI